MQGVEKELLEIDALKPGTTNIGLMVALVQEVKGPHDIHEDHGYPLHVLQDKRKQQGFSKREAHVPHQTIRVKERDKWEHEGAKVEEQDMIDEDSDEPGDIEFDRELTHVKYCLDHTCRDTL